MIYQLKELFREINDLPKHLKQHFGGAWHMLNKCYLLLSLLLVCAAAIGESEVRRGRKKGQTVQNVEGHPEKQMWGVSSVDGSQ